MDISTKKCAPCEGGLSRFSMAQATEMQAKHTPEWKVVENGVKINREFKFKNFKQALAFVNKVGDVAEAEGHHPDISFGWGYANITIYTHAIGGLHENDFILASKVDRIL